MPTKKYSVLRAVVCSGLIASRVLVRVLGSSPPHPRSLLRRVIGSKQDWKERNRYPY